MRAKTNRESAQIRRRLLLAAFDVSDDATQEKLARWANFKLQYEGHYEEYFSATHPGRRRKAPRKRRPAVKGKGARHRAPKPTRA